MGNFLERLEPESPNLFGGLLIFLGMAFPSLDKDSLSHNTSSPSTQQIVLKMTGRSQSGEMSGKSDSGQRHCQLFTIDLGPG